MSTLPKNYFNVNRKKGYKIAWLFLFSLQPSLTTKVMLAVVVFMLLYHISSILSFMAFLKEEPISIPDIDESSKLFP